MSDQDFNWLIIFAIWSLGLLIGFLVDGWVVAGLIVLAFFGLGSMVDKDKED